MKILPKSKKAIPPVCLGLHLACIHHTEVILQPTQLTDLISKLLTATHEQLPIILKTVNSWKWPHSDIHGSKYSTNLMT